MILVSGATGFLGGRLARTLRSHGKGVVALGRNKAALQKLSEEGIPSVPCELSLSSAHPALTMAPQLEGEVDTIVHCAALSSPFGPRSSFFKCNVEATRYLIEFAKAKGVRRFIHISSPAVYFQPKDQLDLKEDSPLPRPFNTYAQTKRMSEDLVLREFADRAIILRPRGIYGPGDNALLPRLITAAQRGTLPLLREGQARTDITHVDDVVSSILAAIEAPASSCGQAYNISGGEAVKIAALIEDCSKHLDIHFKWRPVPVWTAMTAARAAEVWAAARNYQKEPAVTRYGLGVLAFTQTLNIEKAEALLGWRPQICFEDGFEETMRSLTA